MRVGLYDSGLQSIIPLDLMLATDGRALGDSAGMRCEWMRC
jgi:hypothetical protein